MTKTKEPKPENEMTSNDWYWRGYHKGEESKKERIAQLESDAIQQKVNYRKALEDAKQQGKLDQLNNEKDENRIVFASQEVELSKLKTRIVELEKENKILEGLQGV
jgi:hypothetical protein